MKRFITFFSSLILGGSVCTGTDAIFYNAGTITSAVPIDATVFYNQGVFTNITTTDLPYDMSNVRYFTNNGTMSGSVGFKFDTTTTDVPGTRKPLINFVNGNRGNISAVDQDLSIFSRLNVFNGFGAASYLQISATNLVNRGNLSVGTIGLMQLSGKNVNLSRGSLSAGEISGAETNSFINNFGFSFFNQNTYGVTDIYGGAGSQTIGLAGGIVGGGFGGFSLGYFPPDNVFSPFHDVQFQAGPNSGGLGGFILNAFVSVPLTYPAQFEAHAFITPRITPRGIDKTIQVVFVKTNFADTNITATVRFGSSQFFTLNQFGRTAVVELSTPELDPITGLIVTNAVYLLDNSAVFGIVSVTNFFNSSVRPSNYEVTTLTPAEWTNGLPPNVPYDPLLIYPGNRYQDQNVVAEYSGYAAQVGRNPENISGLTALTSITNLIGLGVTNYDQILAFPDPTNQPGRIEINADTLDLTLARIRAEGLLTLNAKHLVGEGAYDISAGIIDSNLGSTNDPSLVISNIFPSHFKRVRGNLYAYSAIWNNTETNAFETNNNQFQVLILDHDLKADYTPTIRFLTLSSSNVVIKDNLTITRNVKFQARNLTFEATNTVTEGAVHLGAANFVGVKNFLVESNAVFQGADDAYFGFNTAGWDSVINRGTISAVSPLFNAKSFQNSGSILASNVIIIQAQTADLSNGTNMSGGNIEIAAGNLLASHSTIAPGGDQYGGALILSVTNLLTDFGSDSSNVWQVTDGFSLLRKPTRGDLMGTEIRTIASGFQQPEHLWAGKDVGPGPNGFTNNVALGRLVLDIRSPAASLRFTGTSFSNALYVVNLDFEVSSNVDINTSLNNLLVIDPNMRIYYVNSNVGDKLTNAFPGRIIQVDDFAAADGLSPLVVIAKGFGIVTPNLDGKNLQVGDSYKMKATPGAGQVFAGWSGGTNSPDAMLDFKMRRNLVLQANFVSDPIDPVRGEYNGLFYDPSNGVQQESSGFLNLKLARKGKFSGKVLLGKPYPFKGSFNNSGDAQVSISRGGKTVLTLNLQLDLTGQSDRIHGTVAGDGWVSTLLGDRANAGLPPVAQAGKYTMIIPGVQGSGPAGDGFGTVDVSATGGLRFKGTLADGSQVNQSVNISRNGQWPLYVALPGNDASIWSWVTFTNDYSSSFQGGLSWIKKAKPGRNYRDGFTNITSVVGSDYSRPAKGTSVLDIPSGTVTLSGGDLNASITNEITLSSNNVVNVTTGTNRLSITISLPNGLVNGNFVHPDTKKSTPIKGVVLQKQNSVRGFFLGTNQSGAVILESN